MMIDDWIAWEQLGVEKRDYYLMVFHFEMMKTPGYWKTFSPNYDFDCCVCSHNTPKKQSIFWMNMIFYAIVDYIWILENNYCTPLFTFPAFRDILVPDILKMEKKQ